MKIKPVYNCPFFEYSTHGFLKEQTYSESQILDCWQKACSAYLENELKQGNYQVLFKASTRRLKIKCVFGNTPKTSRPYNSGPMPADSNYPDSFQKSVDEIIEKERQLFIKKSLEKSLLLLDEKKLTHEEVFTLLFTDFERYSKELKGQFYFLTDSFYYYESIFKLCKKSLSAFSFFIENIRDFTGRMDVDILEKALSIMECQFDHTFTEKERDIVNAYRAKLTTQPIQKLLPLTILENLNAKVESINLSTLSDDTSLAIFIFFHNAFTNAMAALLENKIDNVPFQNYLQHNLCMFDNYLLKEKDHQLESFHYSQISEVCSYLQVDLKAALDAIKKIQKETEKAKIAFLGGLNPLLSDKSKESKKIIGTIFQFFGSASPVPSMSETEVTLGNLP